MHMWYLNLNLLYGEYVVYSQLICSVYTMLFGQSLWVSRAELVLIIMPNATRVSGFFSECCLCISANLILYFMYVNQKLSCKMGSNKVFLNLNLNLISGKHGHIHADQTDISR